MWVQSKLSIAPNTFLPLSRDSGNDFGFPEIAANTGCFHFFGRISSVVSFRVDMRNEKRNQLMSDIREPTFLNLRSW